MLRAMLLLASTVGFFVPATATSKNVLTTDSRGINPYTNIFGKSAIKHLVEGAGFGYENYSITTEDGYILNLNRIVNLKKKNTDRGYPLLLINGFMMHSEAWLVQEKLDSSTGGVWANLGYDVWLGDQRGTMRSRNHVNMTVKDNKFWDFSFDEAGLYDTSAFINFILKKTGYKDLILSCISLGCSFHAVLISERPEYNDKIRSAIYFVPLVNNIRKITEMTSFLHMWFYQNLMSVSILEKQGIHDMFSSWGNLRKELYHVCKIMPSLNEIMWRFTFGKAIHIPTSSTCHISALASGGTNLKTTKHVLQAYETGDFAKYDYGREENMKRYGSELPPLYNITKITSFVAIYYSDADVFASPEGVAKTRKSLGGGSYGCKMPEFNHVDVAIGSTFRYVLPDVIEVLNAMSGYKNNTAKLQSGKCPSLEWIRGLTTK